MTVGHAAAGPPVREPSAGPQAGARLRVDRLRVTGFRNYVQAELSPSAAMIVLTGENGAGKTNLLEALSLLTPGRGLRGVPFPDLAHKARPEAGWSVSARVVGPMGETDIGTGLAPGPDTAGATARIVRVDGVTQRGSGVLSDHVRLLWLTPAMDRLFTGPPGDRRRFLDRLVAAFDPAHGTRVNAFEKAMRERNRLLDTSPGQTVWLEGVETQMAELGVAVAAARCETLGALSAMADDRRIRHAESPFPWVGLSLDGGLEARVGHDAAVEIEDEYRRMLRDSRGRDAAAGRTLEGPHRTDLDVVHGPKDMAARLCSTGEQKALLIGMVLAHARVIEQTFDGYPPVLLLDEIAAHLDRGRRDALFGELADLGAQVWMTGTEPALFAGLGDTADYFTIEDGAVRPSAP